MDVVGKIKKYAFARARRNNPERLWVHYSIALAIIFGLLTTTHLVNRTITNSSITTAATIKTSNSQVMHGQDILTLANRIVDGDETDFNTLTKAINNFAWEHASIISSRFWSNELDDYYFSSGGLHTKVNAYVLLAQRFEVVSDEQRRGVAIRLDEMYGMGGLRADLIRAANMIQAEAIMIAGRLARLQRAMLAVSAVVLMFEAMFIFLPAQLTVKSAIRRLRRQTLALQSSQKELQQTNAKLEQLVNHDQLTGLPNRGFLTTYLANAIAENHGSDLGVLFVGLDNFKAVNDAAGHDYGDRLLIAVAEALQSCVDEDNIVARVGGDEFFLVTHEPTADLVKRITASLSEPFEIMGRRLLVNASIGYLNASNDDHDPLTIFADAGVALQTAKNAGGNRAQAFTPSLRDDVENMQQMQMDLVDAIKNGEIEPWFQPQVRLVDGALHGAEVLARWRHPTRGLLTPDKFLPAAERAGLMIEMDHAIWKSAMDYALEWQTADLWRPCVSLNAAPDTISDPYLVERFLLQMQRAGLNADQVVVEVLETTLIDGSDDMAAINIDSLAECGIALELDDFGTGYASLSKLTQLPLAGIKLDRSLVAPLPDTNADSVVRAILALALELGLYVVAEGIEEDAQAQHLNSRGCAIGQGYGFARPMPPDEFRNWLGLNAGSNNAPIAKRA